MIGELKARLLQMGDSSLEKARTIRVLLRVLQSGGEVSDIDASKLIGSIIDDSETISDVEKILARSAELATAPQGDNTDEEMAELLRAQLNLQEAALKTMRSRATSAGERNREMKAQNETLKKDIARLDADSRRLGMEADCDKFWIDRLKLMTEMLQNPPDLSNFDFNELPTTINSQREPGTGMPAASIWPCLACPDEEPGHGDLKKWKVQNKKVPLGISTEQVLKAHLKSTIHQQDPQQDPDAMASGSSS